MTHPDDADLIVEMNQEFRSQPTSRVLRLHANDGGWTPIHVTLNRVELRDGVFAGLLSLRLPTEQEATSSGQRSSPAQGHR